MSNVVSFFGRAIRRANREPRDACAHVNEQTACQILAGMSDAELAEHIRQLDVEHAAKRAGLRATADALARALHERWLRAHG
jgi:molecular chaperone GrpE (heat shock protein)